MYSITDVIRITGLSESSLRRYERKGVIRPQRVGDRRVYVDADIDGILAYAERMAEARRKGASLFNRRQRAAQRGEGES